jgi:hypothetical protein
MSHKINKIGLDHSQRVLLLNVNQSEPWVTSVQRLILGLTAIAALEQNFINSSTLMIKA